MITMTNNVRSRTQLATAQYDPAVLFRPTWKATHRFGVKKLKQPEIEEIRLFLEESALDDPHNSHSLFRLLARR